MRSQATWKVIAADLPIGLVSEDAIAHGDGPPRGREIEIADLLVFMKHAGIRNTVWITADMHYTAAHHYDPNAAVFQDFEPFWEFISGPLHAGTWAPAPARQHVRAERACSRRAAARSRARPRALLRLQFFGHVAIDGETEVMTVTLKDVDDHELWSIENRAADGEMVARLGAPCAAMGARWNMRRCGGCHPVIKAE